MSRMSRIGSPWRPHGCTLVSVIRVATRILFLLWQRVGQDSTVEQASWPATTAFEPACLSLLAGHPQRHDGSKAVMAGRRPAYSISSKKINRPSKETFWGPLRGGVRARILRNRLGVVTLSRAGIPRLRVWPADNSMSGGVSRAAGCAWFQ